MIGKRDLLLSAAATAALASLSTGRAEAVAKTVKEIEMPEPTGFALALGGGAAKAFAHIPILEAIDELGVRPAEIAGTSMGAILGGLYASGMTAREIREFAVDLLTRKPQLLQRLFLSNGRTWQSLFNVARPAIIEPVVLFETVLPSTLVARFSDLRIPMKIIATDFNSQSQVVLEEGPLLPAIAASSALPILLTPVELEGRVLIDGGFVNPTPFDVLDAQHQITVAIDVTGSEFKSRKALPTGMETWIGSFSITLHSLVAAKLACTRPDLLVEPPIGHFKTMDFFRISDILAAAEASKDSFKQRLTELLDGR
ncbi:patatin-like phospholipase family protein [Rhodobacterales bacterium]|nr:patatin-like phospholipase family protein [Rhodobacterales bacterium]